MTDKRWDEMTPRERDALVAEKVMGWDVYTHERPHPQYELDDDEVAIGFPPDKPSQGDWDVPFEIQSYTSSIAAAWEVVMEMRSDVWDMDFHIVEDAWECQFTRPTVRSSMSVAKTAPEAICIAALRACGVDV